MSLADYEDFVYRAGLLDEEDPVAAWQALGETARAPRRVARHEERAARRRGGHRPHRRRRGSDLDPVRRQGELPRRRGLHRPGRDERRGRDPLQLPGELRRAGWSRHRARFEGGEVVEAQAGEGEDFLREMLAMDDGARRLGEFAFGMNEAVQEFTGHTLFDEKIGGTVHLALGKSYPESGGVNQSALHWDLVCDLRSGSEVYADGELVYRDGEFLPGSLLIALLGDTHLPRGARRLPAGCLRARSSRPTLILHTGDFTTARSSTSSSVRPGRGRAREHGRRRAPRAAPERTTVEAEGLRIGLVHDGARRTGRHERLREPFPTATSSPTATRTCRRSRGRREVDRQPGKPDRAAPGSGAHDDRARRRGAAPGRRSTLTSDRSSYYANICSLQDSPG